MTETFLEVAVPECSAEEFDGELVVINLDTGIYFSIKDAGAIVWNDLAAGHSVEALQMLAGNNRALASGIGDFVQQLLSHGLMRMATARLPTAPTVATAIMQIPELEAFGDMQNLLLLDPVHEVDGEAGWPHTKKA